LKIIINWQLMNSINIISPIKCNFNELKIGPKFYYLITVFFLWLNDYCLFITWIIDYINLNFWDILANFFLCQKPNIKNCILWDLLLIVLSYLIKWYKLGIIEDSFSKLNSNFFVIIYLFYFLNYFFLNIFIWEIFLNFDL